MVPAQDLTVHPQGILTATLCIIAMIYIGLARLMTK